eukprot:8643947-Pyramimonas_sp.AAC.1
MLGSTLKPPLNGAGRVSILTCGARARARARPRALERSGFDICLNRTAAVLACTSKSSSAVAVWTYSF